jgi:hypothetical protein
MAWLVAQRELLLPLVDPGVVGVGDLVVGRLKHVASDGGTVAVVVEVEALVEALVDQASGVVGSGAIELGSVACPVQAFGEALGAQF